jgi:hypothetical protein
MKTKRKSISKRVRFSVFSRDGFACRYCGATSETVQLVIDHIEPVSKGGSDEPENLVTACQPCNAGKSDKPVNSTAVNESHRLALAQEMQEQKTALKAAKEAAEARLTINREVCNYYCELRGVESVDRNCLRTYVGLIEKHGAELVFGWMELAANKLNARVSDVDFIRYVCGIRRKQAKDRGEVPNA